MPSKALLLRGLFLAILVSIWIFFLRFIASQADNYFLYAPSFPYSDGFIYMDLPRWIYSWANFDGVHYLTIIRDGYGEAMFIEAFFPVYPYLVKFFTIFGIKPVIAGIYISALCLWAFLLLSGELLAKEKKAVRFLFVAMMVTFPTAFFFQSFYTESFFMMCLFGAFVAAQKKLWWLAALAAAVASGSRIIGVFIAPALVVEFLIQKQVFPEYLSGLSKYWSKKQQFGLIWLEKVVRTVLKNWWQVLVLCLGATGFALYSFYLWKSTGDPLYFFHVQSEFGSGRQESLILFPQVVWRYIKILKTFHGSWQSLFTICLELFSALFGFVLLVYASFKVRASYVVFGWAAFLIPTFTGTFSSMPRYVLVVFPIWMVLARLLASSPWYVKAFWFLLSTGTLIYTTMLFVQGYWVA